MGASEKNRQYRTSDSEAVTLWTVVWKTAIKNENQDTSRLEDMK